jgi:hypothetical protein
MPRVAEYRSCGDPTIVARGRLVHHHACQCHRRPNDDDGVP